MIGQGYAPSLILFIKMKRLLFSLLAMLITSVCLAQDDNNNKRDVVTKETVTQFSNDEELLEHAKHLTTQAKADEANFILHPTSENHFF